MNEDDLRKGIAELTDALRTLLDEQNGPPLMRRQRQWKMACDEARRVLKLWEE
jgi:hypothetical protein